MDTNILCNKTHINASIVIKLISLIASVYGLIFTIQDLMSFTFYTTLSNIVVDIALVLFIILDIILLKTGKNYKSNSLYIVKYMLTVAISLTFLIYMFILAPTNANGIFYAYFHNYGGSFGVHFVGPVFAIIDFLLFDYNYKSKTYHCVYAVIPPLCYVGLVVLLSSFGLRWYGTMYAPYNFLNYGADTGWFGFDLSKMSSETLGIGVAYLIFVLLLFFLALGWVYILFKNKRFKKVDG